MGTFWEILLNSVWWNSKYMKVKGIKIIESHSWKKSLKDILLHHFCKGPALSAWVIFSGVKK